MQAFLKLGRKRTLLPETEPPPASLDAWELCQEWRRNLGDCGLCQGLSEITASPHLGVPSQLCRPRSLRPQQILQRVQMPAWEGAWLRVKAQGQMEVRVVVPGLGNTLPPPQPGWAEGGLMTWSSIGALTLSLSSPHDTCEGVPLILFYGPINRGSVRGGHAS